MLRAVDISSAQAGISPASLDCDIVIVKATGGNSYVNPYWRQWADEVLASGKQLGLYHYACEYGIATSGKEEARFFLSNVEDYIGKAVLILDWENQALMQPVLYAREWLDAVASKGCTPMFYGYASNVNSTDYSMLVDYPLWMASYLNRYQWSGWVDPDNIWGTGDWDSMTMYQYTSTGRIAGWGNSLDLSVFYGDSAAWKRLEGGSMGSIERMVEHAIAIANDDYYGYSWADRWDHNRDCSSLIYDSADYAGYPVGRGPDKTRYTGTMIDDFTKAGFTKYNFGSVVLQRGDILLRDPWGSGGHTEMYIGNSKLVGAHSAEDGGVYGQPGDQTGNEISIGPMWGSWDYVLRPPEDGGMMGGWIEDNGRWWYQHEDGTYTTNDWEWINDHWYYFDAEGWMVTGWLNWKGNRYYLQPKTLTTGNSYGYMVTGNKTINGKRYLFEDNGAMFKGFRKGKSGAWYCFGSDGAMIKDDSKITVKSNGKIKIA